MRVHDNQDGMKKIKLGKPDVLALDVLLNL